MRRIRNFEMMNFIVAFVILNILGGWKASIQ